MTELKVRLQLPRMLGQSDAELRPGCCVECKAGEEERHKNTRRDDQLPFGFYVPSIATIGESGRAFRFESLLRLRSQAQAHRSACTIPSQPMHLSELSL